MVVSCCQVRAGTLPRTIEKLRWRELKNVPPRLFPVPGITPVLRSIAVLRLGQFALVPEDDL